MTLDNVDMLSDMPSEISTQDTLKETLKEKTFDNKDALAKALREAALEKQNSDNLGAKLLPKLGKYGLHLLQVLVDEEARKALFEPISENRDDPKMDFVENFDKDLPSQLLGYAKMLEETFRALQTEMEKQGWWQDSEATMKIALSAILQPLSDIEALNKNLPCIIMMLMIFFLEIILFNFFWGQHFLDVRFFLTSASCGIRVVCHNLLTSRNVASRIADPKESRRQR